MEEKQNQLQNKTFQRIETESGLKSRSKSKKQNLNLNREELPEATKRRQRKSSQKYKNLADSDTEKPTTFSITELPTYPITKFSSDSRELTIQTALLPHSF